LKIIFDEVKDALQLDRADVGAVRTEAVLHHRALPALGPCEQRRERHHEREDEDEPLGAGPIEDGPTRRHPAGKPDGHVHD
jgi:hypothetical protein